MSQQPKSRLAPPKTLLIVVLIIILAKYWYERSQSQPEAIATETQYQDLLNTMERRLEGLTDSLKRRVNHSDGRFEYQPFQASYQVIMHVREPFFGRAIVSTSMDCKQWLESFSVQMKPKSNRDIIFDYQFDRTEDLSNRSAEIISTTDAWSNGTKESDRRHLKFIKKDRFVEVISGDQSLELDPDTKLSIEVIQHLLSNIEKQEFNLEYYSEPREFSAYPVRNETQISAYQNDPLLNHMWLIKSKEHVFDGTGYVLDNLSVELINDRATTLYVANVDHEGVLYEMLLNDFEYKTTLCNQLAQL